MAKETPSPSLSESVSLYDDHILQYIQAEASHGMPHAIEVADLTFAIAQEPEYSGKLTIDDLIVLRHAALLHDIGYGSYRPYWSGTQEEHPTESAFTALTVLKDLEYYKIKPERLGHILWLIYNHDNTNYTFPAFWLFEKKLLARDAPSIAIPRLLPGTIRSLPDIFKNKLGETNLPQVKTIDDPLIDLLQIVQEADSRLGDAARTLAFCDKRGVPRFSNEGGVIGVGPLWWQESAASNIILALNRALLDAHTRTGQSISRKIYEDGFDYVQRLYTKEMLNSSINRLEQGFLPIACLRSRDIERIFQRSHQERWENYGTSQTYIEFTQNLRGTRYDLQEIMRRNIYQIETRLVPVAHLQREHSGLSSGYDRSKLLNILQVREEIIKRYAMDIFTQIVGTARILVYDHDPVLHDEIYPYSLRSPVIAVPEISQIGYPHHPVLMGDEWVDQAREIGLDYLRVIFIKT